VRLRLAAALLLSAGAAQAADLTLRIEGVRSGVGEIDLAVFDSARNWPDGERAAHQSRVPASPGVVETVIRDLPPGTYAVGGFHDENGNGEFDRNVLGIPTEGFFVSRVTGFILATPSFDEVAFTLPPDGATVTLHMRYFLDSR
jgi:uncharacterized protein (DUF2141 family)